MGSQHTFTAFTICTWIALFLAKQTWSSENGWCGVILKRTDVSMCHRVQEHCTACGRQITSHCVQEHCTARGLQITSLCHCVQEHCTACGRQITSHCVQEHCTARGLQITSLCHCVQEHCTACGRQITRSSACLHCLYLAGMSVSFKPWLKIVGTWTNSIVHIKEARL